MFKYRPLLELDMPPSQTKSLRLETLRSPEQAIFKTIKSHLEEQFPQQLSGIKLSDHDQKLFDVAIITVKSVRCLKPELL